MARDTPVRLYQTGEAKPRLGCRTVTSPAEAGSNRYRIIQNDVDRSAIERGTSSLQPEPFPVFSHVQRFVLCAACLESSFYALSF